ncbi:MAG: hypothetical protein M3418_03035, partial [Gemmatimonadota bacterium]|nr:hypothetical protein [Gemmatimonadota bacterium]
MTRSLISSREMMLVRTLAALLLVFGVGGQALAQAPQAEAPTETQAGEALVYRIPVTGVIEMGLAPFIERSLREAAASGAQAAILDIDTPGGRVDAAERIVDAVGDAGIPVYAFVNRRAFSA